MSDFYRTLFGRRDVRGEFLPRPVPDATLARLLIAAHHAPSVGLSQPWRFMVIRSAQTKAEVHDAFTEANREAEGQYSGDRRRQYRSLRLQGIVDAPVNLCIACDRRDRQEPVLGAMQQANVDLYSTVCAVQNLWLAARAEGLGLGWVSIIDQDTLADILDLPDRVVPVAYVCLGFVSYFRERPELEMRGWEQRRPVDELVFAERWEERDTEAALYAALAAQKDWPQRCME